MNNQKSNVVNLMMYKALSRCLPKPTMWRIEEQHPKLAEVIYFQPSWIEQPSGLLEPLDR